MSGASNEEQIRKVIKNLERIIGGFQTESEKDNAREERARLMAKVSGGYRNTVEPKETLQQHDFVEDGYNYNTSLHKYKNDAGVREYEHDKDKER